MSSLKKTAHKNLVLLFCAFHMITLFSQNKKRDFLIRTVAFYNLENLFDTINDPSKKDELSPIMDIKTNRSKVYQDKLFKLGSVISKIGKDKAKNSPVLVGVAEIENRKVLEDLVRSKALRTNNYNFIHIDSPDERGIDVGLLYQKKHFTPIHYEVFNPKIYKDNYILNTRDILWVNGLLDGEEINIIVNHWPSRRGGERKTRSLRKKAAYSLKKVIEKIRDIDKDAKIIIMGDFNDDPISPSFKKVLHTVKKIEKVSENDLYNPYENLFQQGLNTLGYGDKINLFDQILVSYPLLTTKKEYRTYKLYKPSIFNKNFLIQKKGKFKGYPFRSFKNGNYTGGYSDHYPVYIHLLKEVPSK